MTIRDGFVSRSKRNPSSRPRKELRRSQDRLRKEARTQCAVIWRGLLALRAACAQCDQHVYFYTLISYNIYIYMCVCVYVCVYICIYYCRASHTGDACRGRGRERERGISSELADMTCCELHLRCRHRHCRRCRCCRRCRRRRRRRRCCCCCYSCCCLVLLSLSLLSLYIIGYWI